MKFGSFTSKARHTISALSITLGAAFPATLVSADEAAFRDGHADRQASEAWFNGLSGAFRDGAQFWASHRSDARPPSCALTSDVAFRAGCEEAKRKFDPTDGRRRAEPDYKAGWNSPLDAATRTVSSDGSNPADMKQAPSGQTRPSVAPVPDGLAEAGRKLFAASDGEALTETFICPNPPSAYPVILTIDDPNRSATIEITTDTTATHCVQVFRDGAYASVWRGQSAGYCSMLFPNENVHQTFSISGDNVKTFAHSTEGDDVGFMLNLKTGIVRFYAGKSLECHRARS